MVHMLQNMNHQWLLEPALTLMQPWGAADVLTAVPSPPAVQMQGSELCQSSTHVPDTAGSDLMWLTD
jgi:hypothetical protein